MRTPNLRTPEPLIRRTLKCLQPRRALTKITKKRLRKSEGEIRKGVVISVNGVDADHRAAANALMARFRSDGILKSNASDWPVNSFSAPTAAAQIHRSR
jgi:hypothetical protein